MHSRTSHTETSTATARAPACPSLTHHSARLTHVLTHNTHPPAPPLLPPSLIRAGPAIRFWSWLAIVRRRRTAPRVRRDLLYPISQGPCSYSITTCTTTISHTYLALGWERLVLTFSGPAKSSLNLLGSPHTHTDATRPEDTSNRLRTSPKAQ